MGAFLLGLQAQLFSLWNRISVHALGGLVLLAVLMGWRWSLKREGRKDERRKMQQQIDYQVRKANRAAADAAGIDVDEWLREHGLLRE